MKPLCLIALILFAGSLPAKESPALQADARILPLQEERDVPDPIGGTLEAYERCAQQIEKEIDRIVGELEC